MANNLQEIGKYVTDLYDPILVHSSKYNWLPRNDGVDVDTFKDYGFVLLSTTLVDKLGFYRVSNEENEVVIADANNYADYNGNVAEGSRTGFPIGGDSVKWELYRVRFIRARQRKFDTVDFATKGGERLISRGNAEFYRQAVVPERDAVYTSIILAATDTNTGNRKIEDVTKDNIADKILDGFAWISNHGAEQENQVLLLTNESYLKLVRSPLWINYRNIGTYSVNDGQKDVKFDIETFNGRPIIILPDDRNYSDVALTNNGYTTSASSRKLNFVIVNMEALHAIDRLAEVNVYDERTVSSFRGLLFNYLYWYDLIIPYMSRVSLYASLENSLLGANKTNVSLLTEAGQETGTSILRAVYTEPAGIKFAKVYIKSTEFGSVGETQEGGTLITYNSPFVPIANEVYVALTNASGVIVAKSVLTNTLEVKE